jgi:hypothetical protein
MEVLCLGRRFGPGGLESEMIRVECAKRLLVAPGLSVSEIAYGRVSIVDSVQSTLPPNRWEIADRIPTKSDESRTRPELTRTNAEGPLNLAGATCRVLMTGGL